MPKLSPELPTVTSDKKVKVKGLTFTNHSKPVTLTEIEHSVESRNGTLVKPTEILIKTKAVSVNPIDILLYKFAPKYIKGNSVKGMGGDFSGSVLQVGSEVKGVKVGDEVFGNMFKPFSLKSSFQDYLIFDPTKIYQFSKIPEKMSFSQAAALPVVSGTAYQLITAHGNLNSDSNVLILGGGTSVGLLGLQFAKHYYGAKNVIVTCSDVSSKRAIGFGADKYVDYTKGETREVNSILEIVKEIGKFDLVFDTCRDSSVLKDLDSILKSKKEGGKFIQLQGSSTWDYDNPTISSMFPKWSFFKTYLKSKLGWSKFEILTMGISPGSDWNVAVDKLWSENKLQIPIDSTFDFETEFSKGLERVSKGKAKGKVVLELR